MSSSRPFVELRCSSIVRARRPFSNTCASAKRVVVGHGLYVRLEMAESLPPVAVGYVRVSTEEQAVSGLGLEAQRAAITNEAACRGYELAGICQDAGVSG